MKNYEHYFVRGPSPSYSDEATSENEMSLTLPIEPVVHSGTQEFLNEKTNYALYTLDSQKQGRNTFAFWMIVSILLVLTVGNLILTLTIFGVLHLGKGIHGMELIPEEEVIKFYGITDLDRIYSKTVGNIEGFADVPVTITGDDSSVYVRLLRNGQSQNRIILGKAGIEFRAVNNFEIKDPTDGAAIFSTHRPQYDMPDGANSLLAKTISASRIASPIEMPLNIDADVGIAVKGSEGISLDASNVFMQAENIVINSTQGATILEAGGIFLNMDKIPIVSSEYGLRTGNVQYKICICAPQGILFRIAIPRIHNGPKISCAHFSSKHDPCALN